ncbi:UNVERIFIED_CONTAM: hypothetical protein GTU68_033524 [Idotea baltica]|nr:hypothetical protein [Idotea baltica]
MTDPIADMLTRIRNGLRIERPYVDMPCSKVKVALAEALQREGYDGVSCDLPDNTHIVLKSADKQAVGQFAAEIRSVRKPEPYKGKGIRYQGEIIDDVAGVTLCSASTAEGSLGGTGKYNGNVEAAARVGDAIGKRATEKGISAVVFDRGTFKYHGRVAALADAAREAGLKF